MPNSGKGVEGIQVRDEAGTFRGIYLAQLADAVYGLGVFQKKRQATSKRETQIARTRFKQLNAES